MGQTVVLRPSNDEALAAFLESCPAATVYHTPQWRDVLRATYGYQPFYLGHIDGDSITAILPLMFVKSWLTGKRLVSLPFSNTCGPIGRPEAVTVLMEEALSVFRQCKARALEIRTQADLNAVDDRRFKSVSYFVTSIVPLDENPTRVWKRFKDKNLRTEVRQAGKKGIKVSAGESEEDLEDFYQMFATSRLRHGVPPQPYAFFRNLWKHLWPESLDLFLARHDQKVVGGLISLGFKDTICTAYIGSDIAYRSHRVHQLMIWKSMEKGCLKGYAKLDFLRTPKNSESQRYFKERWRAYEVDLDYLYHPEIVGTASTIEETAKYGLMTKVLKRSPDVIGRLLGRALYRHLG